MNWVNDRRLRVYPRLILATEWIIVAINFAFHQGWQGAIGQIIGIDFLPMYAAALLYRNVIDKLYDFAAQYVLEQALITPTPLPGVMPFYYPPYVALAYIPLTMLAYPGAFISWSLLGFLCAYFASRWLESSLPDALRQSWVNWKYLLILILGFFPFVLGWQVGQNHAVTLLLTSGAVFFCIRRRWIPAGVMVGLLVYKPQFVLGFLIVWLVWREWRALGAFAATAGIWAGITWIQYGWEPFLDLLKVSSLPMLLPYLEGWPTYLLVTPYGLLTTLLPPTAQSALGNLAYLLLLASALGLGWYALRLKNQPTETKNLVFVLALLFPLIATPYTLVHDLVILIPAFVLMARAYPSRKILYAAITTYFACFVLPVASYASGIALLAFVPIGLAIFLLYIQRKQFNGLADTYQ